MVFKEVKYESYEDALERLRDEMKGQGSLTDFPESMDDHSERIRIKLENGSILFITKKRQEMK